LTAEAARCDIAQKLWTPPPKPSDCTFDYGFGAVISDTGPANLTCTSDTLLGATVPGAADILPYGRALRAGQIVCASHEAGVQCRNEANGHGFKLAKEAYELF
jgi:hypothetical protein